MAYLSHLTRDKAKSPDSPDGCATASATTTADTARSLNGTLVQFLCSEVLPVQCVTLGTLTVLKVGLAGEPRLYSHPTASPAWPPSPVITTSR